MRIKFKDHLENGQGNTEGPIDIYVTASSLSSLVKQGSGFINVDGINGPGKVDGRNLKTLDASAIITGTGNTYFNAEKTISAHVQARET